MKLKKLLTTGLAALLLTACGNNEEQSKPVEEPITEEVESENEPTQEELNEQLKSEAVLADFDELYGDDPPIGKNVYINGEVGALMNGIIDEFLLTSKEGNGNGIYKIELLNTTETNYEKGDIVRVYGTVKGKDESDMPLISATILEKK